MKRPINFVRYCKHWLNIGQKLTAYVILRSNYQQTVVSVRADTTSCLTLAVGVVCRWESLPAVSEQIAWANLVA